MASAEAQATRAELYELFAEARVGVERDLDEVLTELDPVWARSNFVVPSGRGMDLTKPAFDRFLWVMLACAGGTSRRVVHVERYRELCVEWMDFWLSESSAKGVEADESLEASHIAIGEALRRTLSTDTRMTWITQLIVESTFAALTAQESTVAMERSVAGELVKYFRRFANDQSLWRGRGRPAEVSDAARQLLEGMSVGAGQYATWGFNRALLSRVPETKPVVRVAGEAFPAALRTALGGLEVCVFEWASNLGVDKGVLFEEALRRSLSEVAPQGVVVLASDSRMHPSLPGNKLQTDLVIDLPSEKVTILGEAKCYLPSAYADRSALGKPLADATVQAQLRADSFRGDRVVSDQAGAEVQAKSRRAVPLVVPLQSSGQTVWSSASLREAGVVEGVPIIPIHQAVLAMSLMADAGDLNAYLMMRQDALARGVSALDEHEFLILHLNGRASERLSRVTARNDRAKAAGQPLGRVHLLDQSIAFRKSFMKDRPPQRDLWRSWFYNSSEAVEPDGYGSALFLNV